MRTLTSQLFARRSGNPLGRDRVRSDETKGGPANARFFVSRKANVNFFSFSNTPGRNRSGLHATIGARRRWTRVGDLPTGRTAVNQTRETWSSYLSEPVMGGRAEYTRTQTHMHMYCTRVRRDFSVVSIYIYIHFVYVQDAGWRSARYVCVNFPNFDWSDPVKSKRFLPLRRSLPSKHLSTTGIAVTESERTATARHVCRPPDGFYGTFFYCCVLTIGFVSPRQLRITVMKCEH